jgi:predicted secreted Zn-dependent protease
MNHLSPIFLLLLFLNFSGKPAPEKPQVKLSSVVASASPMREENGESVPWLFQRRLTWNDFLCEPKRNSDAVASTSTSLGISYRMENGSLEYTITCNFSKHKSWGLLKTDYILAHEQGHFDITEIYARKLHKALQDYTFNRKTYRQDINAIYTAIVREKEAMQATYDGESDHSRHRRLQYDWLDKIDQLLAETEPWANYPG